MKFWQLALSAALMGLMTQVASAGDCCNGCGGCNVKKVCRLVCETDTITETCWGCECEDICLLGLGKKCKTSCCDSGCCGTCDSCCASKCKPTWIPTCHKVRTIRVPVLYEREVEVKVYKCVVECICCDPCCGHCTTSCCGGEVMEGGDAPTDAPPAPSAYLGSPYRSTSSAR